MPDKGQPLGVTQDLGATEASQINVSGVIFPHSFRDISAPQKPLQILFDAARALEKYPDDPDLRGYLRLCARSMCLDPDVVIRSNAYVALNHLSDSVDRPWLLRGLSDSDEDVRALSIYTLADLDEHLDVGAVEQMLHDPHEMVRSVAAIALVKMLGEDSRRFIDWRLEMEANHMVRAVCIYQLLSPPLATPTEADIRRLLKDERPQVKKRVRRLLAGEDIHDFVSE